MRRSRAQFVLGQLSWSCFSVDSSSKSSVMLVNSQLVSCQMEFLKLFCLVGVFVSFNLSSMPLNYQGVDERVDHKRHLNVFLNMSSVIACFIPLGMGTDTRRQFWAVQSPFCGF